MKLGMNDMTERCYKVTELKLTFKKFA